MRTRLGGVIAVVIVSIIAIAAGITVVASVGSQCRATQKQWRVLQAVIVKQNAPQKPSPIILRALPEFRQFFTPGNPSYVEAQRLARQRTKDVLDKLGPEPSC